MRSASMRQLTDTERFADKVEAILGKRVGNRTRNRPTKATCETNAAGVGK